MHRTLKLTVNGEPFDRVPVGKRVYIAARLRPTFTHEGASHKFIAIQRRKAGSSKSENIEVCADRATVRGDVCWIYQTFRVPATYYFQAFLIDTGYDGRHHTTLVRSAVVTVTWVGDITPTEATIEAAGATRGENLETGDLTCTGTGHKLGTSCYVDVPEGTSVTLKATLDVLPPSDWTWEIVWELNVGNDQVFACPKAQKVCTKTVTVPMLPAPAPVASNHIHTPQGLTGPSMYISPCRPGDPPAGHPCTS